MRKAWHALVVLTVSTPQRYEMQDLSVTEVLPQQVALSECFIQIYERTG